MRYVSYNSNQHILTRVNPEQQFPQMYRNMPYYIQNANYIFPTIEMNQQNNQNINKNKKIIIDRLSRGNKTKINPQDRYGNQNHGNTHKLTTKKFITAVDYNNAKDRKDYGRQSAMSTNNTLINYQKNMQNVGISEFTTHTPQQSMLISNNQFSFSKIQQFEQNTNQNTNCNTQQRLSTQVQKKDNNNNNDQFNNKIYTMFTQFDHKYVVKYQTVNVDKNKKIYRSLLKQIYQVSREKFIDNKKNYKNTIHQNNNNSNNNNNNNNNNVVYLNNSNNNNNNNVVFSNNNINNQYNSITNNINLLSNKPYRQNTSQKGIFFFQPLSSIVAASNYASINTSLNMGNNQSNNNKNNINKINTIDLSLNINNNGHEQDNNCNGQKYKINHKCSVARRVKTQTSSLNKQQEYVYGNNQRTSMNKINSYVQKYNSFVPIPRIKSERIYIQPQNNERKVGIINTQNYNSLVNIKPHINYNASNNHIKIISSSLNTRNQPIVNQNCKESSVEKLKMIRQQLHQIYNNRNKSYKNSNKTQGEISSNLLNICRNDANINNNGNNKCNGNTKENTLEHYKTYLMQNKHQNNYHYNHRLLIKCDQSK